MQHLFDMAEPVSEFERGQASFSTLIYCYERSKTQKINKNSAKVKIYNATLLSMSPVGSTTNGRVLIKKVLSTWIAKISCHGQRQILHHLNPVPTPGGGGWGATG
jgi:hypothetical protein